MASRLLRLGWIAFLPLLAASDSGPTAAAAVPGVRWALAIHGGAGVAARGKLTPEKEAAYRAGLSAALAAGSKVLSGGGPSVDAVEAAIRVLEDDPHFNAGRGAVFTAEGRIELDASIMDGRTRAAGAVAAVTRTRNPISLARAVMEKSPHVMLAGDGADVFSKKQGLEQVDPRYFWTKERWRQLEKWRQKHASSADPTLAYGTVGAIAIDSRGHLAAGASTGGVTGKLPGRIGDTAVIGAGVYAVDGACAVSATGSGEFFIRSTAARQLCDRIVWKGQTVQVAADATIAEIGGLGGDGGLIAMDGEGTVAFSMNTIGMYRGRVTATEPPSTAIYANPPPR